MNFTSGTPASFPYTLDHLGNVREMTNSSGVIQAQYAYSPWGEVTKLQGSADSDFGYAGYYVHARSGLNLTTYRAYSPVLGRWISRDPIGENGGANLYSYVGNNPISFVDPLGLATQIGTFANGQGLIYMNDDGSIFTEGAKPDSDIELMIANGLAGLAKSAAGASCPSGMGVASSMGGASAPMALVRNIGRGETIADLCLSGGKKFAA